MNFMIQSTVAAIDIGIDGWVDEAVVKGRIENDLLFITGINGETVGFSVPGSEGIGAV